MPLVIPDIENITNGTAGLDFQAVTDSTDWAANAAATAGNAYVVSGMEVTQDTGSDMYVAVAAGVYVIGGIEYTYAGSGGSPIAISTASATDRRDIVSIDNTGTVNVTAGTACGTAGWTRSSTNMPPVKPPIPSNNCLLGEVGVTSSTTAITTVVNIVDKTVVRVDGNYSAVALTSSVALTTTTTSQTVILTSGTLGVGTWAIDAQCTVVNTTTTASYGDGTIIWITAGSASVTFLGPNSAEQSKAYGASPYASLQVSTIAQITGSGTLTLDGVAYTAVATAVTKDAAGKGNPTGIVCVRIA